MRVYCRNGVWSRPGLHAVLLLHTQSRAPLGSPSSPSPPLGRGTPASSPVQAQAPVLSPTPVPPSVADPFPSLLAQGTPPSQPEESCTNHLHCRAAPHWGHEQSQQRCWGSCPLPAAPESSVSSSASPVAPPAPGPCCSCNSHSKAVGWGTGLKASPHKTLIYWVVGTGAAEQEGQGMSHRVFGFCPRGRRNHRAKTLLESEHGAHARPPPWHR